MSNPHPILVPRIPLSLGRGERGEGQLLRFWDNRMNPETLIY